MSEQVKVEVGQVWVDSAGGRRKVVAIGHLGITTEREEMPALPRFTWTSAEWKWQAERYGWRPEVPTPDPRDAVVEAARKMLWPNCPSADDMAILVAMSAGTGERHAEAMEIVERLRTAQSDLRTALSALDRAGGGDVSGGTR